MKKIPHVAWDWNGTLFDDVALTTGHQSTERLGACGVPVLGSSKK
jgi:hypothetical protein